MPSAAQAFPASSWPAPGTTGASAAAAASAGFLTAFTVSVGGELPLGELVLVAVFLWIVFRAAVTGSIPAQLPRTRLFRLLLVCQLVAFAAYVFSDLYRHSSVHDMGRGWARMIFLAIDIVSVAYLLGCSRLNLLALLAGQFAGDAVHALAFGALYDDMWKFGFGVPVTYLVLFMAALLGRPFFAAAALAMSAVHFALDYRSFGAICLMAGAATLVTFLPRGIRAWLAVPAAAVVLAGLGFYTLGMHREGYRAARSDISRSSMLIAAAQGFIESPLVGQGSWFSRSDVFDNFMYIRARAAKEAHIGGFPEADEEPGTVAIHSQVLVALAEGGIFGATFFLAFGAALAVAICRLVFSLPGSWLTGPFLLILFTALYNWLMSPFSGAHRVYIAVACGVLLMLPRPEPAPPRTA